MKKFRLSEEKRKYAREYMRKYTARKRKEKALLLGNSKLSRKNDREQIVEEFLSSLKKVLLAA